MTSYIEREAPYAVNPCVEGVADAAEKPSSP